MKRKPTTAKEADLSAAKQKTARKPKTAQKATGKPRGGPKAKGQAKSPKKAKAAPAPTVKASEAVKPETVSAPLGRPTSYKPEYARIARVMCGNGATDAELADAFGVTTVTIWRWQAKHSEFCNALKIAKGEYDDRVERSLAQRALGYTYDAVKIFMPSGAENPIYAPYQEHCPPDPGAAKLWLTNRRGDVWREKAQVEHGISSDLAALLGAIDGHGASLV